MFYLVEGFIDVIVHRDWCMSCSCGGVLVIIVNRDGVLLSPVEAFLMLSYTGMVYVLSCRGLS